jgi:hypothetical protein
MWSQSTFGDLRFQSIVFSCLQNFFMLCNFIWFMVLLFLCFELEFLLVASELYFRFGCDVPFRLFLCYMLCVMTSIVISTNIKCTTMIKWTKYFSLIANLNLCKSIKRFKIYHWFHAKKSSKLMNLFILNFLMKKPSHRCWKFFSWS